MSVHSQRMDEVAGHVRRVRFRASGLAEAITTNGKMTTTNSYYDRLGA